MNMDRVLRIADAVLYEGYSLYPYRSTALKNRQRWHFGVLYPRAFCEREEANDAWSMQTECLVSAATEDVSIEVCVLFLALLPDTAVVREVAVALSPRERADACTYARGEGIRVAGAIHAFPHPADDTAVRRPSPRGRGEQPVNPIRLPDSQRFSFSSTDGIVEARLELLADSIYKLTVRIENTSPFSNGNRDEALAHSLVSTHTILRVEGCAFVSAIDPPAALSELSAACCNIGAWPVLIGAEHEFDTMLCAPIILYDHPKIAPQSAGDHFDCTEIDEILELRILTLTEDEKREMRRDERTRALLERTEALHPEQLAQLHGALRNLSAPGHELRKGLRVRIRPKGRADIFDLALEGRVATVESVERDFEDRVYAAVTVEDDPGRDLGRLGQPGHRFFFRPDELEAL